MSITRAFTTRRVKQSLELRDAAEGVVSRSSTTGRNNNSLSSIRNKISAPVQLISTTNMLSYNAPDIYPKTASSTSTHSTKSEDDEDSTPSLASDGSTPPTSPDSPFLPIKRTASPEPNHLSCYFTAPGQAANVPAPTEAPVIPTRAPSHTKKSYDNLTRHRSTSRMSEQSSRTVSTKASFSFSRSSSTSTNTTATSHTSGSFNTSKVPLPPITQTPLPAPPSHRKESISHPFGQELAKVSELAEEYSPKAASGFLLHEEEKELLNKGFMKFSPDSYLSEIQGLYTSFFAEEKAVRPLWI